MRIRPTRTVIAALLVALTVIAAFATTSALAMPRSPVKAGSTGNAKLDNICGQMADLINDEIRNGNDEETNGNYGAANAWFAQAADHISRAQQAGCVLSMRKGVQSGITRTQTGTSKQSTTNGNSGAGNGTTGGGGAGGGTVAARKRIIGRADGVMKNGFSTNSCDLVATLVNQALDNADTAAQAGDADAAAGWRERANGLLAAGRANGCSFSAAPRRGAGSAVGANAGSGMAKQ